MRSRLTPALQRVAVIASVIGVSVLGNLRLQASEVGRPSAGSPVASDTTGDPRVFQTVGMTRAPMLDEDSVADDVGATPDSTDDGHFIPAIYAWDPDVRFIYYRHISKWM